MKPLRTALAIFLAMTTFSVMAQDSKPNPFTGRTSEMEEDLLRLERAKIRAALANEELTREKAEQERRRMGVTGSTRGDAPRVDEPQQPARTTPRKANTPPAQPAPQIVMPAPAPIAPTPPRLIGTVETQAGWIAVVDYQGRVSNIAEGRTVAGVTATEITPISAKLNGRHTPFAAVVSRVYADEPRAPAASLTSGQSTRVVTAQQAEEAIRNQPRTAPMDLGRLMPNN